MKLKLNQEEGFSGLPQLLDDEGGLVAVIIDQKDADEIMKRVNAYDQLGSALCNMKEYLTNCGYGDDHPWIIEINAALTAAGAA